MFTAWVQRASEGRHGWAGPAHPHFPSQAFPGPDWASMRVGWGRSGSAVYTNYQCEKSTFYLSKYILLTSLAWSKVRVVLSCTRCNSQTACSKNSVFWILDKLVCSELKVNFTHWLKHHPLPLHPNTHPPSVPWWSANWCAAAAWHTALWCAVATHRLPLSWTGTGSAHPIGYWRVVSVVFVEGGIS